MRDSDVRAAVKEELAVKYADSPNTRIVEEMGLWSGTSRVDIAVINGELQGFELKSERDTLARLSGQAELYNQVFDRVTLVTAKRHYEKAVARIPNWWGIACAEMLENENPKLSFVRRAQKNSNVIPIQLARLLWRSESLAILEKLGACQGFRGRTAEALAARLTEVLLPNDLATHVRDTLKARSGWLGQTVGDKREMTTCNEASPNRSASAAGSAAGDLFNPIVSPASN